MLPEDLVSKDIIEMILRNDQGEEAKLVSFRHVECCEKGENFFNVVKRVNVTYVKKGDQYKTSYVAKLNPCRPNDPFNSYRRRAMLKERFFYKDFLPVLNTELAKMGEEGLRVPKYVCSFMAENREVIVFEDLMLKGFKTLTQKEPMDEAHVKLITKEICRLHAASFSLQKNLGIDNLERMYPLLTESWVAGDLSLREAFEKLFEKGVDLNLRLTKVQNEFQDLIPWIETLRNQTMKTLLKELYSTPSWKEICHGDLHRANVLFRYNEFCVPEEVMVVDWQTIRIATPSSELSYLLYSSFPGSSREQFISVVTKTYHETYVNLVGLDTSFTIDEFEERVRKNNFGLLICFYLVPLSLCVNEPSELFQFNDSKVSGTTRNEDELSSAKETLRNTVNLASLMADYLKAIHNSTLW